MNPGSGAALGSFEALAALAIDFLLGLVLIALALQVVIGRHLFRSIVFFVAFGLAMALLWARLGAPDLALADAAIGAGVTGALLMAAFRRLVEHNPEAAHDPPRRASRVTVLISLLAAVMVAVIGLSALSVEPAGERAGTMVMETLPELGLGNPVTGVLLAFRGFDTLIEMAVLLTAFLGARAIIRDDPRSGATTLGHHLPLVRTLVALVLPLAALIALHLLWIGSDAPGGAFQAGALLAGAGVLLFLTGRLIPEPRGRASIRLALIVGVSGLVMLVLIPLLLGRPLMGYLGRTSVLLAEAAMMVSVAVTLTLLFAGAPSVRRNGS